MRILLLCVVFLLMMTQTTTSQISMERHAMTYKLIGFDHKVPITNEYYIFDNFTYGAEVGYFHFLNKSLNLGVPLRIASFEYPKSDSTFTNPVIGGTLDLTAIYKFNNDYILKENSWFAPYLFAGIGGKHINKVPKKFDLEVPLGLGINFKLHKNFYLQLQTEYRVSLLNQNNNMATSAGFLFTFGAKGGETKDTDGDGIPDDRDKCPEAAGTPIAQGCPDSDNDGILDKDDECPNESGSIQFGGCNDEDLDGIRDSEDDCPEIAGELKYNGCPPKDTDGDGLFDDNDECPDVAGDIRFKGCPGKDTDGDGLFDEDDNCPEKAGLKEFKGCPAPKIPDTDGDGINDPDDRCPKIKGTIANKGCPEIKAEDKAVLTDAMRSVKFETGKDVLKKESLLVLNQIAEIMVKYPSYSLTIEGHTDNVGQAATNLELSRKRALACKNFLINNGVAENRMSHTGYGEDRPASDNSTEKGRALNRRTEFKLTIK